MISALWTLTAHVLSRPRVADAIINRAVGGNLEHYSDIVKNSDVYMRRWWIFNPVIAGSGKYPISLSIRLHHIMQPDQDDALHDHPWDARSIVLRGTYVEQFHYGDPGVSRAVNRARPPGSTRLMKHGTYHKITHVDPDGVWTIFITYKYRGAWGFWDNFLKRKVHWRKFLGLD